MVCVAGRVGEGFANFQGKASGFPASQSISQIDCLGFVSGEFARLAAEVCDALERLRVQWERHHQRERRREMYVESVLVLW